MNQTKPPAGKVSPIFLAVLLVILIISASVLYQGFFLYLNNGEISLVLNYLLLGVLGLALSSYLLFRTRKRMLKLTAKIPRMATTVQCEKCGFKSVRDFKRGDYIFKQTELCPKCNEKMLISSIYREIEGKKEKEKTAKLTRDTRLPRS